MSLKLTLYGTVTTKCHQVDAGVGEISFVYTLVNIQAPVVKMNT